MEWPLPLWLVLREELAELRPPAPDASKPPALYNFFPADVLDLEQLEKKLARPELERFLISVDKGSTEIKPPAAKATPQISPEAATAEKLNRLLDSPDLYKAFPDLPESQWIKQQKPESLPKPKLKNLKELNRALLDRAFAGAVRPADHKILADVVEELHSSKLSALCFSGGGIRSATFCLGVVQGLARKLSSESVLEKFDYLSTVSGGGYLGGWLAAWTHWSKGNLPEIVEQLTKSGPSNSKLEPEADPIFYLRNFSNYLTPRNGLLSADTWTLVAIYFRNLLLNWLVLIPLLIALLALPRLVLVLFHRPTFIYYSSLWSYERWTCLGLAGLGFACAMFYQGMARPSHLDQLKKRADSSKWLRWWLRHRGQESFLALYLVPLMLSAFIFATYAFHAYLFKPVTGSGGLPEFLVFGAVAAFIGWIWYAASLWKYYLLDLIGMLLSALAGVALFYFILMTWTWFNLCMRSSPELYLCLAPPLVLVVFLLAATIFAGFATFWTDDEDREYWARMSAWVLIASFAWTALGAISLFGPEVFSLPWWNKAWSYAGIIIVNAVTAYLGWSDKTPARLDNESARPSSAWLRRGLPILAAISIVLILAALAVAVRWAVNATTGLIPQYLAQYHALSMSGALLVTLAAAFIGEGMSYFIDPNEYSLHAMYRNRLIRAYLGASRDKGERKPNPFTGFDPSDNIAMSLLWKNNPGSPRKLMPFINMTLNMVDPVSKKLAWQERKAESFTITPLHSGSFWVGYRRSSEYACAGEKTPRGITLGTATAISGAAVSPDMGYNSSPIVSMLLTLFNVRLGWWLGNPGAAGNNTYQKSNPGNGAKYLVDEALGRTNDEKPYVYLSDGGHFENLGLYEMVLRRCRTIVVIDADEDHDLSYENLGNAIRKIRTDLGISIEFSRFSNFRKRNDGDPTLYCSVGKIGYERAEGTKDGHLLYIKPTIRGDESADILSYEKQHPDFPHETTADQWFSESQFESYRALGECEITRILEKPEISNGESDTYAEAREILRNFNSNIAEGALQDLSEVLV